MDSDELSNRLIDFAVRIIKLCSSLPKTYLGTHIYKQLIRSSTSVGANYEEARGAESDPDFLHKLNITLKEARETLYWIRIVERTSLIPAKRLTEIITENGEICGILIASVRTLKSKCDKKS